MLLGGEDRQGVAAAPKGAKLDRVGAWPRRLRALENASFATLDLHCDGRRLVQSEAQDRMRSRAST
jgi:hypothetical protein